MKFNWEIFFSGESNGMLHSMLYSTYRSKVIGGWLVKSETSLENDDGMLVSISESMVFVPDPKHEWSIEDE